jgi:DNA-binding IscR family transcriptional regulator
LCGFLYVSRVASNNKIYGGLFLLPVFMAGLYLSWLILLFGAQVAYAFQNRALYLQEKLAENVNQRGREFVAFRLMACLGQRFQRGLSPATAEDMSVELGIPSRLVQQVLQTLIAARLVIEISGAEPAYTPARPLESITAHHVLMAMRATQGQELITRDEPMGNEVYGEFARIQEAEKLAASSVTMLALVNRTQARPELEPPPAAQDLKLKPALVPDETAAVPSEPVETRPLPPTGEDPRAPAAAGPTAEWSEVTVAAEIARPPERETSTAPVVPPTEEAERDFPL